MNIREAGAHDQDAMWEIFHEVVAAGDTWVFDADTPVELNPVGACPPYKPPNNFELLVREKEGRDELETERLIRLGTPALPMIARGQGGMNRLYQSAIAQAGTGVTIRTAAGTIPAHAHPPSTATTRDGEHATGEADAAASTRAVDVERPAHDALCG